MIVMLCIVMFVFVDLVGACYRVFVFVCVAYWFAFCCVAFCSVVLCYVLFPF